MLIIPVIQVGLYPCSAWLREFRYWGFGRTAVRTACMSYWFWAVGLVSDDAEPLLEGLDGIHHLVSGNIVLPQCLGISSDATDRHVWPYECRGSWDSPRLPWNRSSEIPSDEGYCNGVVSIVFHGFEYSRVLTQACSVDEELHELVFSAGRAALGYLFKC